MTNGFGRFSNDGRGGRGHSGGYFPVHDHHGNEDECCVFCCLFGINGLAYILCLRQMSPKVRIALLWIYILTLCLTVGLLLSLTILGTNTFQSAPTDMRSVDKKINHAFCESISLNSSDSFTAYSFEETPPVNKSQVERFNTTYSLRLAADRYKYWGFYLLEGSSAVVRASGGATMFVIKGSSNLQTWINSEGKCSNCYIDKHGTDPAYTYTLSVKQRDEYYFVYLNETLFTIGDVSVYLRRTLYDVSKATSTCSFSETHKPCRFDLSLSSDQVVVYHNGRSASVDQGINLQTYCSPRVWLYVIIFAIIPVLLGLGLSFLFWKFCKYEQDEELNTLIQVPPYKLF